MMRTRHKPNSRDVGGGAGEGNDAATLCYVKRRKGHEGVSPNLVHCLSTDVREGYPGRGRGKGGKGLLWYHVLETNAV